MSFDSTLNQQYLIALFSHVKFLHDALQYGQSALAFRIFFQHFSHS